MAKGKGGNKLRGSKTRGASGKFKPKSGKKSGKKS